MGKRTLKRESKVLEIVGREAIGTSIRPSENRWSFGDGPLGGRELAPEGGSRRPRPGKTGPFRAHALLRPRAGHRGSGRDTPIVLVERRREGGIVGGSPPPTVCLQTLSRWMPGARPRKRGTEQGFPSKGAPRRDNLAPGVGNRRGQETCARWFLRPRRAGSFTPAP